MEEGTMKASILRKALAHTVAVLALAAVGAAHAAPQKTLQAFASDQEISDLFRRWAEEHRKRMAEERRRRDQGAVPFPAQPAPAAPPAALADQNAGAKSVAKTSAAEAAAESLTNVQHAGVDEGGIVKRHGDYLVILRRGRLFTVNIRDQQLRPISSVDAFGGDVDPRGAWYDEMLISGSTIAVIGYSYARGGTEIGLFEISASGQLRYKSTYHLRSNDYYSSRNYASRLIDTKLIFYTPLNLNPWSGDPFARFPAMRRWRAQATTADFQRIAPATRIYRTDEPLDPYLGVALHTVSVCDLARPELDC